MDNIEFFSEDTSFQISGSDRLSSWLNTIAAHHEQNISCLNYIYCSDNYLLQINQEYLQHDYFTDIITFDQRDFDDEPLEGDIFISVERVKDNSQQNNTSFDTELHRVMAHGLLHLLGLNDKTEEEKLKMRESEDACLSLLQN